jgi:hypothetical protein
MSVAEEVATGLTTRRVLLLIDANRTVLGIIMLARFYIISSPRTES